MELNLPTYSTKRFFRDGDTLVAEMSDLTIPADGTQLIKNIPFHIGRMYDDACDVGIALRSHITDKVARFYLSEEKKDEEGDLLYYEFKCSPETAKKMPQMKDIKVMIFND